MFIFNLKRFFSGVFESFSWMSSLGREIFRAAPIQTIVGIFLTICSQLFLLAGFLLPLKIVLLLGSEHIPSYFPIFMKSMDKGSLIFYLSLLSVVFYLFHLASIKFIDACSLKGADLLLSKSNKVLIFEDQEEFAIKGYRRYFQWLASFSFLAFCLVGVLFFYPRLMLVVGGYFLLVIFFWGGIFSALNLANQESVDNYDRVPKIISGFGFLCVFSFIVFDFIFGYFTDVLYAVISLLLLRQFFSKLVGVITDQFYIFRQKSKLSALFFHSTNYDDFSKQNLRGVWAILEPNQKRKWICELIRNKINICVNDVSISFVPSGQPDVFCDLVLLNDGPELGRSFLIKIFNSNRSSLARHEATLLLSSNCVPSLPFVATTLIGGLHCHIFEATGYRCLTAIETTKSLMDFRVLLSTFVPSDDLMSSYIRSRTRSWQRLDDELISRLEWLLGDDVDFLLTNSFRAKIKDIRRKLEAMPHCIFVQDIRFGSLWKNDQGLLSLSNWGRWEVEPMGVRWGFTAKESTRNYEFIELIEKKRGFVLPLDIHLLELSAIVYDFVFFMQRARYLDAYSVLGRALKILEED